MRRWLIVAALLTLFAWRASAQDTTATSGTYLPLVVRAIGSPTATPTATATSTPTRTNTPSPTPTPTLPPPTFNNCQADPNPGAAPNYPVRIVTIDKAAETVTLQNISTNTIDLTGWRMCSVTGNQQHPIGGLIAAGQTIVFPGPPGQIWLNTGSDPGALYTPEGRLASYFNS